MSDQNQVATRRRANLQRWMELRHVSRTDLAGKLSVGRAYISLLFSPERFFGEKAARSIEVKLRMPVGYLDSDGELTDAPVDWVSAQDIPQGMLGLLPRVDLVMDESDYKVARAISRLPPLAFEADWLIRKKVTSRENMVFCAVHGDTMEPYLLDGDTVLIDVGQVGIEDGIAYVIRYGDSLRARRLSKRFDGGLIIRCDNPRYQEEVLSAEDARHIKVLGRVIYRAG